MPPPNVTGQLHMGHAMDETWQDILTRYKRMQGYAALWVPGTDHASIATEAKVVAKMREEGLTKERGGRDGFLERAWDWKNTYGNRNVSQRKKLGSSCPWHRARITSDERCDGPSPALCPPPRTRPPWTPRRRPAAPLLMRPMCWTAASMPA